MAQRPSLAAPDDVGRAAGALGLLVWTVGCGETFGAGVAGAAAAAAAVGAEVAGVAAVV